MKQPRGMMTRREMVKLSAVGLTVPTIIARTALGSEERLAPSERLTLGFIGMGKQNQYHLNAFLGMKDVHVVAVCDVDTTRRNFSRDKVNAKYGNEDCAAYNDYRELIARKDIDAVVIATPDHWHTHPIVDACKAKKHIYCEKPLTLTIAEAKLCIEVVNKYGVVFQTGSQQRSGREFRTACEAVRNGRIGKIKQVYASVGGPSKWCDLPEEPMEPGLDWNLWLGQAPMRPYNSILSPRGMHDHFPAWRAYREYSGGGMTDWGAHHFDIAQWGLGMDDSGPVEIIPPEQPEKGTGVRFIYENGVELIHGGYEGRGGVNFVGTDGVIYVDRGKLQSWPEEVVKEPLKESEKVRLYESPGHHRDWLNAIRENRQPICPVEVGARSVTVCHLGNLAYWTGKRLKWDPKNWRFVEPTEANEWLDGIRREPRRDPWQLPTI
ncbi:MAG: Gfo/Idh/MocA family oxidoreductase [Thermogutta sp.]|nr:Gfo/Idh/MocA family oxidoreductase [Thermogutta sp.]HOP76156.1 Gfo/Idh/MocA family oxidoreductase [Thermogutta sp.]